MWAKKGIKLSKECTVSAIGKEYKQLDDINVVGPENPNVLIPEKEQKLLGAVNLIKEKRCGKIKGITRDNVLKALHIGGTHLTGSSVIFPNFICTLSFYGIKKRARKYLRPILIVKKINLTSKKFTRWILYWAIFIYLLFIVTLQKAWLFRFLGFLGSYKNPVFHLYISEELTICREISLYTPK